MTLTAPTEPAEANLDLELNPATLDGWDDDEEDLPVRPVRRPLGPLTIVLCGLLLAAGAFAGGVIIEKRHVPPATTASARTGSAFAAAARTSTGAPGAAGTTASGAAGGVGSGATVGTVTLVDGTNVYVTEASGTIVKIATTPRSQISITAAGTVATIKPGDTVTATGATGADGTVTATSLRDSGAGGARGAASGASGGATAATGSSTGRTAATTPTANPAAGTTPAAG